MYDHRILYGAICDRVMKAPQELEAQVASTLRISVATLRRVLRERGTDLGTLRAIAIHRQIKAFAESRPDSTKTMIADSLGMSPDAFRKFIRRHPMQASL